MSACHLIAGWCAVLAVAFQTPKPPSVPVKPQNRTQWSTPRAKLKNARTLLDFERNPSANSPDFWWLSNHELIINRCVKSEVWHLCKRDIRTGKETPLKILTDNLVGTQCSPSSFRLSPDGRRAISLNSDDMIICDLASKNVWRHRIGRAGADQRGNPFTFGLDSGSWLEYIQSQFTGKISQIAVCSHNGKSRRIVQLTTGFDMQMTPGGGYDAAVTRGPHVTYVATNEIVLRGGFQNETGTMGLINTADLIQVDLSRPRATPTITKVPLPTDRYFLSYFISPNAKWIIWLTHERKNTSQAAEALWVSDIYGKKWRKVVHVGGPPSDPNEAIYGVQWLPNSKQISVVTHAGLYLATP